jgi:hypothetical protein
MQHILPEASPAKPFDVSRPIFRGNRGAAQEAVRRKGRRRVSLRTVAAPVFGLYPEHRCLGKRALIGSRPRWRGYIANMEPNDTGLEETP